MESSTRETFAKLDYIITDSIFDGHSLNKNGFRFQFQLNKHRQFIKTKLCDWNFLQFAGNLFASVFGTFLVARFRQLRSRK